MALAPLSLAAKLLAPKLRLVERLSAADEVLQQWHAAMQEEEEGEGGGSGDGRKATKQFAALRTTLAATLRKLAQLSKVR